MHPGVLKVKVNVKGHVIAAHLEFHKKIASLSLNSPSLCPFSFLPHPNPQTAVSLRCEFRHSSHDETVCQTDCYTVQSVLSVLSLLSTCAHFMKYHCSLPPESRLSIRQLDLMSKSWNELLRHWRSGVRVIGQVRIVPGNMHVLVRTRVSQF